ncbi:helix-turn-helix domain-containing protein [Armatimonas rosea]|uniref:Transcriptional regulator with XRE-family HTH domain n=1 Tax=Armatimonas rosea TaxID=685828 RepID=A0A7W9SNL3_ARMRO|nr:helix-turn-helix transcriptional regulator [Armatimonas rosea]MBB6049932.1 transcriptional regulator with XRE-family HTH domain [Armatimonas rosea]
MSSDTLTIGQQLQQWRLRRGLSLGALSLRCGIHKSTLSRWERGIQSPSMQELSTTLNVLEVTAHEAAVLRRQLDTPRAALYQHEEPPGLRKLSGGELLRALRLRSGVTQEDAARAAGVTREMLSRWERGERWPDGQKLHALCYALGASLDETLHLTTRGFIEQEPLPLDYSSLIALHTEMTFLSLAPNNTLISWYIAARHAELGQRDLTGSLAAQAGIWGAQGYDTLFLQQQVRMAEVQARASIELVKAAGTRIEACQTRGIVAFAAIEAARKGPRAAVAFLDQWQDYSALPSIHAWLSSIQANYLAQEGQSDLALTRSRHAVKLASEDAYSYGEAKYRERDYARHLLLAGQPQKALPILENLHREAGFLEHESALTLLLIGHALHQLREPREAFSYHEQATQLITRHKITLPPEYQDL